MTTSQSLTTLDQAHGLLRELESQTFRFAELASSVANGALEGTVSGAELSDSPDWLELDRQPRAERAAQLAESRVDQARAELGDLIAVLRAEPPTWIEGATARGRIEAHAAASWTCDASTHPGHARRVLELIEDGDPLADEYLPDRPDLSGEFADNPTPLSLARDITGQDDPTPELVDRLADAFEAGVAEVFEAACTAELEARATREAD